jgi:hypothetical protein
VISAWSTEPDTDVALLDRLPIIAVGIPRNPAGVCAALRAPLIAHVRPHPDPEV